ncbi:MAG TPA: Crp/Fnr family transcriptional regulator [Thermoanaerobaculia bacterium]
MISRRTTTDDCTQCTLRKEGHFCALGDETISDLSRMKFSTVYPKGATLFREGEEARGVFIICSGGVKLVASSSAGRNHIAKIAREGEILGLSAVVLRGHYELSAETLEPVQVAFIRRDDFVRFLTANAEVTMRSAFQLSNDYQQAQRDVRTLGLGRSVRDKFAALLVGWCNGSDDTTGDGVRLKVLLTHEEIAQLIGTTRETVTRLLKQFRTEKLIEIKGSTMIVRNRAALEAAAI